MKEQRPNPLIEEALRWLVVLKDKAASDADRTAFELWRTGDPRHEAAWMRAQQVWMRVGKIGPAFKNRPAPAFKPSLAPLPLPRSPAGRPSAVASATTSRLAANPAMRPVVRQTKLIGRRRLFFAAAAVTAAAVPAGLFLSRPGLFADQRTAVGERRTISLQDGSTVELASASSLSSDFVGDMRRVVLHEGEAFFKVVPDPARPFIVEAAQGRTWVLGTAFDVKLADAAVTVSVAEHSVEVALPGVPSVTVGEGQQVRYGARQIGPVRAADPAQVAAWRRDRLVFQEAPLGEVIADLERYRAGRIVMTDARLRDIPVTAVFDTRQAEAAVETIAATLPIRVRRVTDLLIVLSPKG